MSSQMLHVKPEEIDTAEKRGKYTVSIIGCGETGILHAYLFAETGFKVKCADANQTIVNNLVRGKIPFLKREIEQKLKNYVKTGALNATSDVKTAVSQSDIIVVAVPVEIDEKNKANYSDLQNTCKVVGSSIHCGSLVIVVSSVGVGVMQSLIKETLENTSGFKMGADFALAYSPIRYLGVQTLETLMNQERIIAATDKRSLEVTSTVLGTIARNIQKTGDIKTAEASVLFRATHDDVNMALAKEFALFCEKAGLDYIEVQRLVKSDICSISLSALASDGKCEEPHLLLEDAENLNLKFRIPTLAREMNEEITKHIVNLIRDALKNCGKPLKRARISFLGISQNPNSQSSPKKIVNKLAKMLEAKGAKISFYDSYFSGNELSEMQSRFKKRITEALEGTDCILILTAHDQFKRLNLKRLKVITRMPAAIVDFEGIFDPKKVEEEGFIFRGLGRGVWTK